MGHRFATDFENPSWKNRHRAPRTRSDLIARNLSLLRFANCALDLGMPTRHVRNRANFRINYVLVSCLCLSARPGRAQE